MEVFIVTENEKYLGVFDNWINAYDSIILTHSELELGKLIEISSANRKYKRNFNYENDLMGRSSQSFVKAFLRQSPIFDYYPAGLNVSGRINSLTMC